MGISWPLGVVLYGIGAAKLGPFGAYAGFPMLLIFAILSSNAAGVFFGEWRGAGSTAKNRMRIGVIILVIAAVLFGYANNLMSAG